MLTARSDIAVAVLDNRIYTFGGYDGESYLATVESYSPVLNESKSEAEMLTPRQSAAAAVVDGKIYVIGGYNGQYLRTVEEFDPSKDTNQWTKKQSMGTTRSGFGTAVVDGKIYVIGGYNESGGYYIQ